MLIGYKFQNFRSFRSKTQLNMKAGTQRTLDENLIRENGLRILPSAVIYGANASGKSNIIMSLADAGDNPARFPGGSIPGFKQYGIVPVCPYLRANPYAI